MLNRVRLAVVASLLLTFGAASCSDTWEGVKQDTKENVKTTGEGIEKAGQNIEKQVQ